LDGCDWFGWEEDDASRPKTGTARRPTIDGDEKLHGKLGLGKFEPHMTREEDGEQEEKGANVMEGSEGTSMARDGRGA